MSNFDVSPTTPYTWYVSPKLEWISNPNSFKLDSNCSTSVWSASLFIFIIRANAQNKLQLQKIPSENKPWTYDRVNDHKNKFNFGVVTDRTGGERKGVWEKGIEKIISIDLTDGEKKGLENSIKAVKELFEAARKIDPKLDD